MPVRRRNLLAFLALAPAAAPILVRAEADTSKAQPELPIEPLTIVGRDGVAHQFQIEMALTQDQQTVGEMFRPTVPETGGMLFDWGTPRESTMWMRNTLAPLDMVFINADGTVRSIKEDAVPQSLAVIDSHGPVRATLELAAGTTAKLNIRVGDTVKQRIFGNAN
jgi:uncharacterized membrane protein (UPF0127 family)